MISRTLPSFWKSYHLLEPTTRKRVKKAFDLWNNNPFHPSLHFKCVHVEGNIWSVRVTKNHRALCVWEKDMVTWFWVGSHDDYEQLIFSKSKNW